MSLPLTEYAIDVFRDVEGADEDTAAPALEAFFKENL